MYHSWKYTMQHNLYLCCIMFVALALVGCSESDNPASPNEPDAKGVPPLIEDSYDPLSIGSYWKYTGGENYALTITGGTMIDGKYFFTAEYMAPAAPITQYEYLREEDQTIYSLVPTFAPETVPVLKYNLPVGASWTFTRTIKSTLNYYTYTIVAKDLSRTVLDKQYHNVLQVKFSNYTITDNGDTLRLFSDSELYYARGIGTIEYSKPLVGTTYLQAYQIKK